MVNFILGASLFLNILLVAFILFAIRLKKQVDKDTQELTMVMINKLFSRKGAEA